MGLMVAVPVLEIMLKYLCQDPRPVPCGAVKEDTGLLTECGNKLLGESVQLENGRKDQKATRLNFSCRL